MSNIEAWWIFFGRLTKVDGRVVHSLIMQLSEVARPVDRIKGANLGGGQGQAVLV